MMKRILAIIITVAMVLTLVPTVALGVDTEMDDFEKLQTALEAATSGDTITLTESIYTDEYVADLTVKNGVTLVISQKVNLTL